MAERDLDRKATGCHFSSSGDCCESTLAAPVAKSELSASLLKGRSLSGEAKMGVEVMSVRATASPRLNPGTSRAEPKAYGTELAGYPKLFYYITDDKRGESYLALLAGYPKRKGYPTRSGDDHIYTNYGDTRDGKYKMVRLNK